MTEDERLKLFNQAESIAAYKNDDGKIQELIDKGLDVNMENNFGQTIAERASWGDNYSALYSLWKANAIPKTEYIKEIFSKFEKGITANELYEEKQLKVISKKKEVPDLTKSFSVEKLKLESSYFEITNQIADVQDSEIELRLNLQPFIFDGYLTNTELQFLGLCTPKLKAKIFSKEGYDFENDEIEESSIYIQNVHNPVNLKKLKVSEEEDFYMIEVTLIFNFEYEGTEFRNEERTWKLKVEKKSP